MQNQITEKSTSALKMRGFKFRSNRPADKLKSATAQRSPATRDVASTKNRSKLIAQMTNQSNLLMTQPLSSSNGLRSTSSSLAQQATQSKKQKQSSILLRGLIQRQKDEGIMSDLESKKRLVKMDVANFMAPRQGVSVGVAPTKGQLRQSQKFLHARIFARNLGINQQHMTTPSASQFFKSQRKSLNAAPQVVPKTVKVEIVPVTLAQESGYQIHPDSILPDCSQDLETVVQGHRVAMNSQKPIQRNSLGSPKRHSPERVSMCRHRNDDLPTQMADAYQMETEKKTQKVGVSSLREVLTQSKGLYTSGTMSPKSSDDPGTIMNSPHLNRSKIFKSKIGSSSGTVNANSISAMLTNSQLKCSEPRRKESISHIGGIISNQDQISKGKISPRKKFSDKSQPVLTPAKGSITRNNAGQANTIMHLERMKLAPQRNSLEPVPDRERDANQLAIQSGEKTFESGYFRNGRPNQRHYQHSTHSRRTTSAYNQTPRGAEDHLNAKYSNKSNTHYSPHHEERLVVNDTPVTPTRNLECIIESRTGNNNSATQHLQESPLSPVKSHYVAQKQREEQTRCLTPSYQGERSVDNRSNIFMQQKDILTGMMIEQWQHKTADGGKMNAKNTFQISQIQLQPEMGEVEPHMDHLSWQIPTSRAVHTAGTRIRPNYIKQCMTDEDQILQQQRNQTSEKVLNQGQLNYPSSGHNAAFANTDGNINISNILVHAKRDQMIQEGSNAYTNSCHFSSSDMLAQKALSQPHHAYQIIGTTSESVSGFKRNSFGQIDFSKPVNKLVSDVAQAIGESVRRMQPRSQQRSSVQKQDYGGACNSKSQRATVLSRGFRLTKSSQGSRPRIAKGTNANQGASYNHKNNLLNRIAQLTMASHYQITENQQLKEQLQDLAHEQQLHEQLCALKDHLSIGCQTAGALSIAPLFAQPLLQQQNVRVDRAPKETTVQRVDPSLCSVSSLSRRDQASIVPTQHKTDHKLKLAQPSKQKCNTTGNSIVYEHTHAADAVTRIQLEESLIEGYPKARLSSVQVPRQVRKSGRVSPLDQFPLQVTRKPIVQPQNKPKTKGPVSNAASSPAQSVSCDRQVNLVATKVAPTSAKNQIQITEPEFGQDRSQLTNGNMTMLNQCSTWKAMQMQELVELTEQTLDARKKAEPLQPSEPIQTNNLRLNPQESYPTTIYDEKMIESTEMVSVSPTNEPTSESNPTLMSTKQGLAPYLNQNALGAAEAQISPHVRVVSDSAMVPVYDIEALENLYARSTSSELQISVQNSPKEESLFRPLMSRNFVDSFQNQKQFEFDGLRIQSQGTSSSVDRQRQMRIHQQYLQQQFGNTGFINTTNRQIAVSKYANSKPNRWLQQAIKRGKQKRKQAREQALLHSKQAMNSQYSSFDDRSPNNGPLLTTFPFNKSHQHQPTVHRKQVINHNKHHNTSSVKELASQSEQQEAPKDQRQVSPGKLTLGIHLMTAQGRQIHSPMDMMPQTTLTDKVGMATQTQPNSPRYQNTSHSIKSFKRTCSGSLTQKERLSASPNQDIKKAIKEGVVVLVGDGEIRVTNSNVASSFEIKSDKARVIIETMQASDRQQTCTDEEFAIFREIQELQEIQDYKSAVSPQKKHEKCTQSLVSLPEHYIENRMTTRDKPSNQVEFKALTSKLHKMGGEYNTSQPNLRSSKITPPVGHTTKQVVERGASASRNNRRSTSPQFAVPQSAGNQPISAIYSSSSKQLAESLRVTGARVMLAHSIDTTTIAANGAQQSKVQTSGRLGQKKQAQKSGMFSETQGIVATSMNSETLTKRGGDGCGGTSEEDSVVLCNKALAPLDNRNLEQLVIVKQSYPIRQELMIYEQNSTENYEHGVSSELCRDGGSDMTEQIISSEQFVP